MTNLAPKADIEMKSFLIYRLMDGAQEWLLRVLCFNTKT